MREHRYKKRASRSKAGGVDRQGDVVKHGDPDRLRMLPPGHFLSIACKNLHEVIHSDADQRQEKDNRKQIQLADG